jgi:WD40 repeat protein
MAGTARGVLAISPNHAVVAVQGTGRTINLYFTTDGALLRSTPPVVTVNSLSFSGDGALLAAGEDGFGNNVQIFQAASGTLVRTLAGDPNASVQGVAFARRRHARLLLRVHPHHPAVGSGDRRAAHHLRPGNRVG